MDIAQTTMGTHAEQKAVASPLRFWIHTALFGVGTFLLLGVYQHFRYGQLSVEYLNQAAAQTGILLMGLSFSLGSASYFWDVFDRKIVYRKQLGLFGFSFVFAHILITLILLNNLFPVPSYYFKTQHLAPWPSVVAIISTLIFIVMTLISNTFALKKLGSKRWRAILRYGGFTAYSLGTMHFVLKKYQSWGYWFLEEKTLLPPLSALTVGFAVWVLFARILMGWDIRRNKELLTSHSSAAPASSS